MYKYIDSIAELLTVYLIVVTLSALSYMYFETSSLGDSIWWACVTAMTVGYGDMYPLTIGGRVTAVILMHTSVLFILPLLIGRLCSTYIKDVNEFTHKEQEQIKQDLTYIKRKVDNIP